MEGYEQQIAFCSTGYTVCLVIMIVAFALAVLFFILFRIPALFSIMSGSNKRKAVQEMKKSGKIRYSREQALSAGRGRSKQTQKGASVAITEEMTVPVQQMQSETETEYFVASDDETTALLYNDGLSGRERSEHEDQAGEITSFLEASKTNRSPDEFEIIEHTAVVHTNEFI